MKKVVSTVVLFACLFVLVMPVSVKASPRFVNIWDADPDVSISGNTATITADLSTWDTCQLSINVDVMKETLYGWQFVKSLENSGRGTSLSLNRRVSLDSNYSYRFIFTFGADNETVMQEIYY